MRRQAAGGIRAAVSAAVDLAFVVFVLVVVLAFTVQTAIGFASTLICVTLGAHLLPIPEIVLLMVPLSLVQNVYILARHHGGVRWRLLRTRVLPAMITGAAIGYLGVRSYAGDWMRLVFAALVCVLSARELWRLHRTAHDERPLAAWISALVIFVGGVIHGVYATGGPPLAYALGRENLPKHELRSTLSVIWIVMNGALTATLALDHRYDASSVPRLAVVVGTLPIAVVLGEVVHRRVDELRFKKALYALLLAAGVALFFH